MRVLRTKYGCGEETIPIVKPYGRASCVWRRVGKIWHHIDKGRLWAIRMGIIHAFGMTDGY